MSEYIFGRGDGHLSRAAERIAKRHGASLVNFTEPHGHGRHWFTCPLRGAPHDEETARAVLGELRATGVIEGGPMRGRKGSMDAEATMVVRLDRQTRTRVEGAAKAAGVSQSEWVRGAIRQRLADK